MNFLNIILKRRREELESPEKIQSEIDLLLVEKSKIEQEHNNIEKTIRELIKKQNELIDIRGSS